MKIRFSIHPAEDVDSYHCEIAFTEKDLKLEPEEFCRRYLRPVAAVLLSAFEEEWPKDPQKVLRMLNRGGPDRSIEFYRRRFRDAAS